MKRFFMIWSILLFCSELLLANANFEIPLAGNAYEIGHKGLRSAITNEGALISSSNPVKVRVYFKLLNKGKLNVKLSGEVQEDAELNVQFLGKSKKINFSSAKSIIDLGSYTVKKEGYAYIELSAKKGKALIKNVEVTGEATDNGVLYVNNPEFFYWGRRGPSCHLAYTIPTRENVTYYYNEVYVPKGEDVIASYFMANGFAEGYFGMQVNSETERRILFSVWSPFHTDDPKSIPADEQIKLNKKGEGVHTGEFGNEGSGGQSFLRYSWKSGVTYKFLLKGQPDGLGNTDYTAWFFNPDVNDWALIASFKRPKTNTYLKGFHSFLENFSPTQGYLTRKVNFNNQWVFDSVWKKVESAKLTVDNTYHAKQREDATGGVTNTGYFLKMGGFFDEIAKPYTVFEFANASLPPLIDFSKLP